MAGPKIKKTEILKKRLIKIYGILHETYGELLCPLKHSNPLQLMVAVILSAQCTDVRVNIVTSKLFKKYRNIKDFAEADPEEFQEIIRPVGYFRAKSKSIINSCRKIISDFRGKVPESMEELTSLPGIGRKSANVILGNAFGIPGFPVDTHVKRLTNRIGIVKNQNDPVKIEFAVTDVMPDKYWTDFSHLLIFHGRSRCKARKPDCPNCEILRLCDTGMERIVK